MSSKFAIIDLRVSRLLKQAYATLKWTTGQHEDVRFGFRRLIEERKEPHR